MTLAEHSLAQLKSTLAQGITLDTYPFTTRITSRCSRVATNLHKMYGDFAVIEGDQLPDFDVSIKHHRRWYKPQAQFYFDDYPPFVPLPAAQDYAMFEWGLNWCYANHANEYLILHAAVIARQQQSVIMPGFPGAGKSTLTCELMFQQWQLLSDELTLINQNNQLIAAPRPVSLKDQSINIIQQRHPEAIVTEPAKDTNKGTVAHVKPTPDAISLKHKPCLPKAVVFPKYQPEQKLTARELDPAEALVAMAEQGFNYHLLGEIGFDRLCTLVGNCECYHLSYSSLDEAVEWFNSLIPLGKPGTESLPNNSVEGA